MPCHRKMPRRARMPCAVPPHHATPCQAMPCHAVPPYHATPCHAMCRATAPCHAMRRANQRVTLYRHGCRCVCVCCACVCVCVCVCVWRHNTHDTHLEFTLPLTCPGPGMKPFDRVNWSMKFIDTVLPNLPPCKAHMYTLVHMRREREREREGDRQENKRFSSN
jgi:hypothetical protein